MRKRRAQLTEQIEIMTFRRVVIGINVLAATLLIVLLIAFVWLKQEPAAADESLPVLGKLSDFELVDSGGGVVRF